MQQVGKEEGYNPAARYSYHGPHKAIKDRPGEESSTVPERLMFTSRIYERRCLPSVKEQDAQLCESERQRLSQLRRENALLPSRQPDMLVNSGGCGPATRPLYGV